VEYEQLVEAFNILISHVRNRSDGDRFPIEEDFFWSVPVAEMNNVYSDPPALTVGQISEWILRGHRQAQYRSVAWTVSHVTDFALASFL
jgi:hypothetical protein